MLSTQTVRPFNCARKNVVRVHFYDDCSLLLQSLLGYSSNTRHSSSSSGIRSIGLFAVGCTTRNSEPWFQELGVEAGGGTDLFVSCAVCKLRGAVQAKIDLVRAGAPGHQQRARRANGSERGRSLQARQRAQQPRASRAQRARGGDQLRLMHSVRSIGQVRRCIVVGAGQPNPSGSRKKADARRHPCSDEGCHRTRS